MPDIARAIQFFRTYLPTASKRKVFQTQHIQKYKSDFRESKQNHSTDQTWHAWVLGRLNDAQTESGVKCRSVSAMTEGVNQEAKSPMHREWLHDTLNSKHTTTASPVYHEHLAMPRFKQIFISKQDYWIEINEISMTLKSSTTTGRWNECLLQS